jgi:hypothetical protein
MSKCVDQKGKNIETSNLTGQKKSIGSLIIKFREGEVKEESKLVILESQTKLT